MVEWRRKYLWFCFVFSSPQWSHFYSTPSSISSLLPAAWHLTGFIKSCDCWGLVQACRSSPCVSVVTSSQFDRLQCGAAEAAPAVGRRRGNVPVFTSGYLLCELSFSLNSTLMLIREGNCDSVSINTNRLCSTIPPVGCPTCLLAVFVKKRCLTTCDVRFCPGWWRWSNTSIRVGIGPDTLSE